MSRRYRGALTLGVSQVNSRLQQWMNPDLIRSIQRGTIAIGATSATATITEVDVANSRVVWVGESSNDGNALPDRAYCAVDLTNSTTVTAFRASAVGGTLATVSYEIVEYWPGVLRSVQRGTITGNSTATITAVDTTRASVTCRGRVGSAASYTGDASEIRATLTNATTVTCVQNNGAGAVIFYYEVTEFF